MPSTAAQFRSWSGQRVCQMFLLLFRSSWTSFTFGFWICSILLESDLARKQSATAARANLNWWSPPVIGSIKLNVDGGFVANGVGVGVVARDCYGAILLMATRHMHTSTLPVVAEAQGVLWALQLAATICSGSVIIETDCLQVVDHLTNGAPIHFEAQEILKGVSGLCCAFLSVSWSYVSRLLNFPAHNLAHYHPVVWGDRIWISDFPQEILDLCTIDVPP